MGSMSRHFSEIKIARYRALKDLTLQDLGPINLVAGPANTGKTSILEALHALAHQQDTLGLYELVQNRVRGAGLPKWPQLLRVLPEEVAIEGLMATRQVVAGWSVTSSGVEFHGNMVQKPVCPSVLFNPALFTQALLAQAYENSVHTDTLDLIRDVLRNHVCPDLERIVSSDDCFLIHAGGKVSDLVTCGEGMQRIFLMGLSMGWAQNGIFLMDGFEQAMHVSLLHPVAQMLAELAQRLNVQVFLTTQSQEAVEAWTQSALTTHVVGYTLNLGAERLEGPRLSRLIELVGFDLRMAGNNTTPGDQSRQGS